MNAVIVRHCPWWMSSYIAVLKYVSRKWLVVLYPSYFHGETFFPLESVDVCLEMATMTTNQKKNKKNGRWSGSLLTPGHRRCPGNTLYG